MNTGAIVLLNGTLYEIIGTHYLDLEIVLLNNVGIYADKSTTMLVYADFILEHGELIDITTLSEVEKAFYSV